ncbi:MAG: PHB depolymerase family esterase [Polaromonas sp.]|uniref:extracellular catalytic domain type 1 short-chain-length polyhydroxyalkanoate depolymerase n=1 Tax=Polaromonas sp. TaxID=1869339 RepID=UPI002730DBE0|nr:PHB depolymerase family esterase [Polaromonas sp.]MDP2256957.1 PHB depolymerase family esterase [Polaromonas sp.]
MVKSLTGLWLKNIRRMGEAQQAQGRKLLTSLMPKPARSAPVRRAKVVGAARLKVAAPRQKSVAVPVRPVSALPGVLQKSYFPVPAAGQLAPARRMLYWLYLPPSAASKPCPLVVMLHGCQQTAPDFAQSTRMNQLAERKGFAVLYPQQSAAGDRHRCWHWYKRATQHGGGDVALIAQMIAKVQAMHRLDASRTYVAGLSAGAGLATILALRYPALIAAVGVHSAPVFGTSDSPMSAFRAMQHGSGRVHRETATAFAQAQPQFPGMPVILIHGARDPVVRHINAAQLAEQFVIINGPAITRTEPVSRSYAARTGGRSPRHAYQTETYYAGRTPQLLRCEINALGHAWSGGDGSLAFTTPEGPDATRMMWTFFARHRRTPTSRNP